MIHATPQRFVRDSSGPAVTITNVEANGDDSVTVTFSADVTIDEMTLNTGFQVGGQVPTLIEQGASNGAVAHYAVNPSAGDAWSLTASTGWTPAGGGVLIVPESGTVSGINGITAVTGFTPTVLRHDYAYPVGFSFTVGPDPLTVLSLALQNFSGNVNVHLVGIYDGTDNTPLASVNIATFGQPDGFLWGDLGTPLVLAANGTYIIAATYNDTSDDWSGQTPTATTGDLAIVASAFYVIGSGWAAASPGMAFVPPNFRYSK